MEKFNDCSFEMKFRNSLVQNGQRVCFENPDKLSDKQLEALIAKIFETINELDMAFGYEYHETGTRRPKEISEEEQKMLFMDFCDWYDIIRTPNFNIYDYVLKNYPVSKYPRILCVGDGQNCHLGRKLAMQGYTVVSVDPVARKVFNDKNMSPSGQGRFHAVNAEFHKNSEDMINWANVIVGAKVPMCAEQLVGLPKPTVFNISKNAEIHDITFKGVPIKSSEQLREQIEKCKGVRTITVAKAGKYDRTDSIIFVHDERERNEHIKNK